MRRLSLQLIAEDSQMIRRMLLVLSAACALAIGVAIGSSRASVSAVVQAAGKCNALPSEAALKGFLSAAPGIVAPPLGGTVGGLFNGTRMWGAVVNRDGELCAYTTNQADPAQVWPGNQAIAKAKAYTANAFSLDSFVLSTARLYTFTQPGHSLWSLGQSNLFNTSFLAAPGAQGGINQIAGGQIFFGGGVPLYNASGSIVGGVGVSGDTSCADHEIAKRVRDLAGLNPPSGPLTDDIVYSGFNPPADLVFTHPKCLNTYRNGTPIGTESPSSGY